MAPDVVLCRLVPQATMWRPLMYTLKNRYLWLIGGWLML